MSMFKRIVALTMAMITCASFCLVNGGAQVSAEPIDELVYFNPDVTDAFARICITEWPQETENGDTDLVATTGATGLDYYSEYYYSCTAYVDLGATFEDGSYYSDYDVATIFGTYSFGALMDGNDILYGEPGYAILDLESYHYVEIADRVYVNDAQDLWRIVTRYDGDPISLP